MANPSVYTPEELDLYLAQVQLWSGFFGVTEPVDNFRDNLKALPIKIGTRAAVYEVAKQVFLDEGLHPRIAKIAALLVSWSVRNRVDMVNPRPKPAEEAIWLVLNEQPQMESFYQRAIQHWQNWRHGQ